MEKSLCLSNHLQWTLNKIAISLVKVWWAEIILEIEQGEIRSEKVSKISRQVSKAVEVIQEVDFGNKLENFRLVIIWELTFNLKMRTCMSKRKKYFIKLNLRCQNSSNLSRKKKRKVVWMTKYVAIQKRRHHKKNMNHLK